MERRLSTFKFSKPQVKACAKAAHFIRVSIGEKTKERLPDLLHAVPSRREKKKGIFPEFDRDQKNWLMRPTSSSSVMNQGGITKKQESSLAQN